MIVIVKQTTQAMAHHVAFVILLFACVICPLEGRVCTRVRSETGVKTVQYPGECQESFEAKCGWFSFSKCTFNETVPCLKTRNITVTRYRIVEDCCPGYYKNRDGKCVRGRGKATDDRGEPKPAEDLPSRPGVDTGTSVSGDQMPVDSESGRGQGDDSDNDDDDDDDGFFLGISHGAYAGIVCGILFVACVALLTAIHYRKRRLQEEKKGGLPTDQDAAQRQQMIPLEKIDSTAAPAVPT